MWFQITFRIFYGWKNSKAKMNIQEGDYNTDITGLNNTYRGVSITLTFWGFITPVF